MINHGLLLSWIIKLCGVYKFARLDKDWENRPEVPIGNTVSLFFHGMSKTGHIVSRSHATLINICSMNISYTKYISCLCTHVYYLHGIIYPLAVFVKIFDASRKKSNTFDPAIFFRDAIRSQRLLFRPGWPGRWLWSRGWVQSRKGHQHWLAGFS